jgi:hypothetical protein
MGVYLMGVYLMGVYPTGVYLIGVRLIGVYLMGLYLMDMYLTRVSHRCVPHRRAPHENLQRVVNLSRSELQNTSFDVSCGVVPIAVRTRSIAEVGYGRKMAVECGCPESLRKVKQFCQPG